MPLRPGTARRLLKDVLTAIDRVQADLPNGTYRYTNNTLDMARSYLLIAGNDFKKLMRNPSTRPPLLE